MGDRGASQFNPKCYRQCYCAGMGGEDAGWVGGEKGKCTRCDDHEALRRLVAVGDDGARREVASLAPHRQLRAARRALSATRAA